MKANAVSGDLNSIGAQVSLVFPGGEVIMVPLKFIQIAEDLELAGLIWRPEIGDEVAKRSGQKSISILVDPNGLTPAELRSTYIWLPTVEQMVMQMEARQVILAHAGLDLTEKAMCYKTVVTSPHGEIMARGDSIRSSVGMALRTLLLWDAPEAVN